MRAQSKTPVQYNEQTLVETKKVEKTLVEKYTKE